MLNKIEVNIRAIVILEGEQVQGTFTIHGIIGKANIIYTNSFILYN